MYSYSRSIVIPGPARRSGAIRSSAWIPVCSSMQIVWIPSRRYLVEDVVKPKRVADSTLVRLSCVDDDNQGQPLEVLWEKELDPAILTGEAWEAVASKGFDDSQLFAAYLNTLK